VELQFLVFCRRAGHQSPISRRANGRSATKTITFLDPSRDNRPVAVDIAVRRDKEMQANAA